MQTLPDALAILVGALLLDALIGDPDAVWRRWSHPVVWLGRLVAVGDTHLNRPGWSEAARRASGIGGTVLLVTIAAGAGLAIQAGALMLPGGPVLVALAASVFLAQKSLYEHVRRVLRAFASDLPAARAAVSMIVGRDPDSLDEAGVARAAIESTAENFSDGVVAPAFWFAVGGLPGLLAYKAVNTADSMVGHLSDRHRAFGWAPARLDDLLNLAPARLSGVLLALCAGLAGGSPRSALRIMWRDAPLHHSPNAGWPEAAMAGALGLALAGPRVYAAGPVEEPFLNREGRRDARAADICRALRVMAGAAAAHVAIYLALLAAFRTLE